MANVRSYAKVEDIAPLKAEQLTAPCASGERERNNQQQPIVLAPSSSAPLQPVLFRIVVPSVRSRFQLAAARGKPGGEYDASIANVNRRRKSGKPTAKQPAESASIGEPDIPPLIGAAAFDRERCEATPRFALSHSPPSASSQAEPFSGGQLLGRESRL